MTQSLQNVLPSNLMCVSKWLLINIVWGALTPKCAIIFIFSNSFQFKLTWAQSSKRWAFVMAVCQWSIVCRSAEWPYNVGRDDKESVLGCVSYGTPGLSYVKNEWYTWLNVFLLSPRYKMLGGNPNVLSYWSAMLCADCILFSQVNVLSGA
jgi:hypothetical protein